jgi:hypothetical protein
LAAPLKQDRRPADAARRERHSEYCGVGDAARREAAALSAGRNCRADQNRCGSSWLGQAGFNPLLQACNQGMIWGSVDAALLIIIALIASAPFRGNSHA